MTKKRKMTARTKFASTVLLSLMLIFAMFTYLGCDWLLEGLIITNALESAIAEAENLLNTTVTSEDGITSSSGNPVQVSTYWAKGNDKNALNSAIITAKSVLVSAASQDEIDYATQTLYIKINEFKAKRTLKTAAGGNDPIAKTLTVSGLSSFADESFVWVQLHENTQSTYDSGYTTLGSCYTENGKAVISFKDTYGDPWTGTGSFYVYMDITDDITQEQTFYLSKNKISISAANTNAAFPSDFNELTFGSNEEEKTITVTGLPSEYSFIEVYVFPFLDGMDFSNSLGYGNDFVSDGTVTLDLIDYETYAPWTKSGDYYVVLNLCFEDEYNTSVFRYNPNWVSFADNPVLDFSEFYAMGKSITITGLEDYDNERIHVYLSPYNSNIDMGTLSILSINKIDGDSIKMYLLRNSYPWTGSGKYYVIVRLLNYEDAIFYITPEPVDFAKDPTLDFLELIDFDSDGEWTVPENAVVLTENVWASGILTDSDNVKWYSFDVTEDTNYEIFINDYDWDASKVDVVIDIYINGVIEYSKLDIIDSEYGDDGKFKADADGTVYVKVYQHYTSYTDGAFEIAYNTTGVRPDVE